MVTMPNCSPSGEINLIFFALILSFTFCKLAIKTPPLSINKKGGLSHPLLTVEIQSRPNGEKQVAPALHR
jgi:hypothetical protein